ncbi:DUF2268 domain-containing protein [Saccharopolyspora thermophila]|uniref:DUF2268 domain-containing protein n=1 Tax=Saccharopolyspora thermophila TaxID=89367 RepID=A0ABN1CPU4_9PSEU
MHDTASTMAALLDLPVAKRPDALREMLAPLDRVMSAVGGGDVVAMHQQGAGFRLDRDDPRYPAALREMREAGVWSRVRDCLAAGWDRLRSAAPGIRHADELHVLVVLGDPDDEHLTVRSRGYFGLGGFPGVVLLVMWPTATSLAKIGYAAAHELHHNVRYANVTWNPVTVTVGEQVVAEGLAEAFVRELFGEQALGHWATELRGPELQAAYEKVVAGIDVTGMHNLTAYVHGDATARLWGQKPVGLPDFAGYAAGLRIVDAHCAVSGLSAAQSVALSAREILANAGVPTNA